MTKKKESEKQSQSGTEYKATAIDKECLEGYIAYLTEEETLMRKRGEYRVQPYDEFRNDYIKEELAN